MAYPPCTDNSASLDLKGDEPYTLAGYDMVLGLSCEAINSQFLELYNKPIPTGKPPPPISLPGFRSPAAPEYFINHNFCASASGGVQVPGQPLKSPARGIMAHIGAPSFRLAGPTKVNTLELTIPFISEPWTRARDDAVGQYDTVQPSDGRSHSWLYYFDIVNDEPVKAKENLDGWKMSWEVTVDSKDIDIQSLLEKSRDETHSITLPPDVEKRLGSVDSSAFTASAIFCLFTDTTIAKSFILLDQHGGVPPPTLVGTATATVANYMSQLGKHTLKGPSPDAPYVLGYSLKAKLPTLEQINEDLKNPGKTPTFFTPRRLDLGTTLSVSVEDQKLTLGTLNYLLQTHRDDPSKLPSIQRESILRGRFQHPLFAAIQMPGMGLSGAHGIMAFSRQTMILWLKSILNQLTMVDAQQSIMQAAVDAKLGESMSWTPSEVSAVTELGDKNGVTRSSHFECGSARMVTAFKAGSSVQARGGSNIAITYTSDYELNPDGATSAGASRKLYLDFITYYWCNVDVGSTPASALTFGLEGETIYYKGHFRSQYRLSYAIEPGEGGVWSARFDPSRSRYNTDGQIKPTEFSTKLNEDTAPTGFDAYYFKCPYYGSVAWNQNDSLNITDMFAGHNFAQATMMANTVGGTVQANFIKDIQSKLTNVFDGLRTTIILPAGNVFTFKSMDTDKTGALYTSVTWRTLSDVKQVASPDMPGKKPAGSS